MPDICLDAYNLALERGTGIATYTRNLFENLRVLGHTTNAIYGPTVLPAGDDLAAELAITSFPAEEVKKGRIERWISRRAPSRAAELSAVRRTGKVIWPKRMGAEYVDRIWAAEDVFRRANREFSQRGMFTEVRFPQDDQAAPDLMHWTSALPMYNAKRPNIYTIHDLIPLKVPQSTSADKQSLLALYRSIADKADHIVTVSETSRADIIEILGVSEDKVTNTYQSIDDENRTSVRSISDIQSSLRDKFNLGYKDYYLFYGAIEPKKNVIRLLEGYIASRSRRPLIIVGPRGWLDDEEQALLSQIERDAADLSRRIRRYEYLPRPLLMDLVKGARATTFPSIYEGFGLPVLESMRVGTAVMTSRFGALREVSGEAALGIDPYDVANISEGFRTLENDQDLVEALERAGPVQAELFSQERYRVRLGDLYRKLI